MPWHTVRDAQAGISRRQRVEGKTTEAKQVEHREIGRYHRNEFEAPIAMVEIRQNWQGERRSRERP